MEENAYLQSKIRFCPCLSRHLYQLLLRDADLSKAALLCFLVCCQNETQYLLSMNRVRLKSAISSYITVAGGHTPRVDFHLVDHVMHHRAIIGKFERRATSLLVGCGLALIIERRGYLLFVFGGCEQTSVPWLKAGIEQAGQYTADVRRLQSEYTIVHLSFSAVDQPLCHSGGRSLRSWCVLDTWFIHMSAGDEETVDGMLLRLWRQIIKKTA